MTTAGWLALATAVLGAGVALAIALPKGSGTATSTSTGARRAARFQCYEQPVPEVRWRECSTGELLACELRGCSTQDHAYCFYTEARPTPQLICVATLTECDEWNTDERKPDNLGRTGAVGPCQRFEAADYPAPRRGAP